MSNPDPTNEELWAWSVGLFRNDPDFLDWGDGKVWSVSRGNEDWHPTEDMNQAKLIEARMLELGYHVNKFSPRKGLSRWSVGFWRLGESSIGFADTEGRAILLAARRAKEKQE